MGQEHKEAGEMLRQQDCELGITSSTGKKRPWLVDVDVYLEDPVGPKFRMETSLPTRGEGDKKVIVFENRRRPGFDIKFNLIDESAQGYCFPRKESEALWSRRGPGCPPVNYGQQWDEFKVERVVEPDRTILVVHNANMTKTEFGYTLRVTNDDGRTFVDLDPGGSNQNGPTD
jgi:hypothetical protein